MGVTMNTSMKNNFLWYAVAAFSGIPLLVWGLDEFPARSLLKESLSALTILIFFQMIGLLYWSRTNRYAVSGLGARRLVHFHKIIGYACMAVMLVHPVLLVTPRWFEAGVTPGRTLVTILTTFHTGVILGIIAWGLMLLIGITALFRDRLPLNYKTWRTVHGILAVLFAGVAAWHAIDLGRHSTSAMSFWIAFLTLSGAMLFGKCIVSERFHHAREMK